MQTAIAAAPVISYLKSCGLSKDGQLLHSSGGNFPDKHWRLWLWLAAYKTLAARCIATPHVSVDSRR
jgi:hypothetical protein